MFENPINLKHSSETDEGGEIKKEFEYNDLVKISQEIGIPLSFLEEDIKIRKIFNDPKNQVIIKRIEDADSLKELNKLHLEPMPVEIRHLKLDPKREAYGLEAVRKAPKTKEGLKKLLSEETIPLGKPMEKLIKEILKLYEV